MDSRTFIGGHYSGFSCFHLLSPVTGHDRNFLPDSPQVYSSIISPADASCNSIATWKLEYSARDSYGAAIDGWPSSQSLSPAFWHKVTEVFTSNDTLFQQFVSFRTRGVAVVPCTADCKTKMICGLRALRAENGCVSVSVKRLLF